MSTIYKLHVRDPKTLTRIIICVKGMLAVQACVVMTKAVVVVVEAVISTRPAGFVTGVLWLLGTR